MTDALAGFLLGLAGTVHCLGMCGPLVLFSGAGGSPSQGPARCRFAHWSRFSAHHASRLGVYVVLGAAVGFAGGVVADAGWRDWLAIAVGGALVAQALGLPRHVVGTRAGRTPGGLMSRAARSMPRHPLARSIALGVLNGLMPCGLLYAALAAAAGLGRPSAAVVFMSGFGVGSLPAFAVLVFSARTFLRRPTPKLRQAAPVALALLGLMLIARGLPLPRAQGHSTHSTMQTSGR